MSRWRLFLICLSLAGPTVAAADHCQVTYRPSATYSYAPGYSAPYVAPTYQQPYYDRVLLVPKVQTIYDQPSYYYSLGDSYRDALLADAIAFRVLQAQKGAAPAPAYVPRIPESLPGGPATAFPPAPGAAPRQLMPPAAGEIQTAVPPKLQQIVTASCIKCHNGPNQNGLDLSNLAVVPPHARDKACRKVVVGEMPKGGKLAEGDVDAFFEWAYAAEAAEKQARR
jgi:hypothetical protein